MWRKPSFCNFEPPQCPEVDGLDTDKIMVRDSERPTEVAWFTREGWQALIDAVKAGEYDLKISHADDQASQLEQV